jgi:hypothetical protein
MNTRGKGKVILGFAIAAIIVASVFAMMIGSIEAYSVGGEYNIIEKKVVPPQKVLIGQNLEFMSSDGWDLDTLSISRRVGGYVENTYLPYINGTVARYFDVNWPTEGAYYVNVKLDPETNKVQSWDAQLSVEKPAMPLSLKVGTRKVAFIAVGTPLTLDIGGMNLYPEDRVNLVVIGPDGQIKHDEVTNQQFTDIAVNYLRSHYGGWDHTLDTSGWGLGDYTFMIRTKPEYACGLEAESAVKALKIKKVKSISLPRDPFVPSFRQ